MYNYLTADSGTSISVAKGILNGDHLSTVSPNTDRCYVFVEGNASIQIGKDVYDVGTDDIAYVPRGVAHSLRGAAAYYVINNPPFVSSV